MAIALRAPWDDLTFMSPLSEVRAERLVAFLGDDLHGVVVDVGCGWGELLLRVVTAAPESTGIGIDLDGDAIKEGRRRADDRGLSSRVTLVDVDASEALPERADAIICVGATHAWAPPDQPDEPLHYERALQRMRALLSRGGRLVYGDGIWSQPPTPAAIAALGGREDEMITLAELVDVAARTGFAVVGAHEASTDEWDDFESGYNACYARWLAAHPTDHEEAAEVRKRARAQQTAYLSGYRNVLGLAYLQLIAV
jgi:cyclopropane fatty-acyl-phospholipid synthase-like methyltransferase